VQNLGARRDNRNGGTRRRLEKNSLDEAGGDRISRFDCDGLVRRRQTLEVPVGGEVRVQVSGLLQ
ncbi:hypothetical protein U1Q18_039457, partial [Sarracenia purpurea var. burkii]